MGLIKKVLGVGGIVAALSAGCYALGTGERSTAEEQRADPLWLAAERNGIDNAQISGYAFNSSKCKAFFGLPPAQGAMGYMVSGTDSETGREVAGLACCSANQNGVEQSCEVLSILYVRQ